MSASLQVTSEDTGAASHAIPPTLSMQLQSPAPVHFPRREHDTYSLWLLASDSNTTEQETELEETTSDVMQTKSEIGGFPS